MSSQVAWQNVLNLLRDPAVSRIRFNAGSVRITPQLFVRVIQALEGNYVEVRHDPGLTHGGEYDSTHDRLYVRQDTYRTLAAAALIIHEAVHIGLDVARATQMRTSTSEAAAIIAQCIYARAKTRDPSQERLYFDDDAVDLPYELAWDIAGEVLAGGSPAEWKIDQVRAAVRASPVYARDTALEETCHEPVFGEGAGYDGVPGL